MKEKKIRSGMYHKIDQYVKPNNKYIISHVFGWGVSNLYVWSMSKNLPANGFKWRKYGFRFDEKFIESYD